MATRTIFDRDFVLINIIPLDYRNFNMSKKQRKKAKQARKYAGISSYDTMAFDEFIAAIVTNGISSSYPLLHNELNNQDLWDEVVAENPPLKNFPTFFSTLSYITKIFSAYKADDTVFWDKYTSRDLNKALRLFLIVFPYLHHQSPTPVNEVYHDYTDTKERHRSLIKYHEDERVRYGVSDIDTFYLNDHFATVFAIGFKILVEKGDKIPKGMTREEWDSELLMLSESFRAFSISGTPLSRKAKTSFVKYFREFWR